MSEKPILFSAPMVRALLEGRKTQTRRIFKVPKWSDSDYMPPELYPSLDDLQMVAESSGCLAPVRCPYGKPGDRLWVREAWAHVPGGVIYDGGGGQMDHVDDEMVYRSTDPNGSSRWRPSIFMPRCASRITLEVTGVRVQRLQEISEEDAEAEGVEQFAVIPHKTAPRGLFRELWESINGAGSWDANPWVWAVSFERVTEGISGGLGR